MSRSHILYVLFGQRKCSYEGEFFPEALFVDGEYSYEENGGEYLKEKQTEYEETGEFETLKIIEIEISERQLLTTLNKHPSIQGELK